MQDNCMECKYCGKNFKNKKGLLQHQKQYCELYKEEKQKEINEYKHVCICGKKFPTYNSLHGHKARCRIYQDKVKEERDKILTKEFLIENLINKDLSAYHIASIIDSKYIDAGVVINYAKSFGIKTKTIKEAANSKNTREKYKKTCIKKYGKVNALSSGTIPFQRRNSTVNSKYGVKNVFQLDMVKDKIKNSMFENHGVEHPIYIKNRYKNNGRKSKIHKLVEKFLLEKNISHESEKVLNLKSYNNFLKKEYNPRPDIIIKNKNIVIEINGDYWHANPKFYKNNDIIVRWTGETLAENIWKFDVERQKQIESFGYKIINLWENDIKNNFEYIKEMLCRELELNQ